VVTEPKSLPTEIDKISFSSSRKGYSKKEVKAYLSDLEAAFRDLEVWANATKQRLSEVEGELEKAKAVEDQSVDNAMYAVFDAKDRIIERARAKARQIEEEAMRNASKMSAEAEKILQVAKSEASEAGVVIDSAVGEEELAAAREEASQLVAAARAEAGWSRHRLGCRRGGARCGSGGSITARGRGTRRGRASTYRGSGGRVGRAAARRRADP
jgi:DivIVA domain-containing protein